MSQQNKAVQTHNVDNIIDSSPLSKVQWKVIILCFLLAMIDGFDVQSIGYVGPILTDQLSIPHDVMGQIYSAAYIGLMIGALVGSPLADKIGRKPIILFSVLIMGIFSFATSFASSTTELFIFRFLTGVGLGGVMPNINILTAEFSPERKRATLMTVMFVGFPMGIMVGGIAAAKLIAVFGWQSVFIVGGILPAIILPVLWFMLPESPRFMALKQKNKKSLSKILNQISPKLKTTPYDIFVSEGHNKVGSIKALFENSRTKMTLLLWLICLCNFLSIYGVIGWLPSLLKEAGFPLEKAIIATVIFSFGGVFGGLLIGYLMDKYNRIKVVTFGFAFATLSVAMIGQTTMYLPLLLIILFLAGISALGTQFGLNAVISNSYGTSSRSTGLGWALAIGRLGAVVGPILVGIALTNEISVDSLFLLGALPLFVATLAIMLVGKQIKKSEKMQSKNIHDTGHTCT
jgi:AAHS family 4-hydroxybenzoate transporter-like MFS transporter